VDCKAAVGSGNAEDFGEQVSWGFGQLFLAIGQDKTLAETEQAMFGRQVSASDVATGPEAVEEIGIDPEAEQETDIGLWETQIVPVARAEMIIALAVVKETGSALVVESFEADSAAEEEPEIALGVGQEIETVLEIAAGKSIEHAMGLVAGTGLGIEETVEQNLVVVIPCPTAPEGEILRSYGIAAGAEAD
jgi:hypothetical protein